MEEAGILRGGPGGPDQQWPTVSSATPGKCKRPKYVWGINVKWNRLLSLVFFYCFVSQSEVHVNYFLDSKYSGVIKPKKKKKSLFLYCLIWPLVMRVFDPSSHPTCAGYWFVWPQVSLLMFEFRFKIPMIGSRADWCVLHFKRIAKLG